MHIFRSSKIIYKIQWPNFLNMLKYYIFWDRVSYSPDWSGRRFAYFCILSARMKIICHDIQLNTFIFKLLLPTEYRWWSCTAFIYLKKKNFLKWAWRFVSVIEGLGRLNQDSMFQASLCCLVILRSVCTTLWNPVSKNNVAEAGFQLIVVDDDDLESWDYQHTHHGCLLFPTTSETPTFYQDCQIWMHLDQKSKG